MSASDKSDRAGGLHPEPAAQAQPEALIPSASDKALEAPARAIAASKRGVKPSHPSIDSIWHSYVGQARAAIVAFIEEAAQLEKRRGWKVAAAVGLEREILRFKAALPGWWFTVGECQVSADASCGPTREVQNLPALLLSDSRFDAGFHADLPQPATLAEALRTVRRAALEALKLARPATTLHNKLNEVTGDFGESPAPPKPEEVR